MSKRLTRRFDPGCGARPVWYEVNGLLTRDNSFHEEHGFIAAETKHLSMLDRLIRTVPYEMVVISDALEGENSTWIGTKYVRTDNC